MNCLSSLTKTAKNFWMTISYSKRLNALRDRFYDPEFRLAIVGNFSCGKSIFLNALLKKVAYREHFADDGKIYTLTTTNSKGFIA